MRSIKKLKKIRQWLFRHFQPESEMLLEMLWVFVVFVVRMCVRVFFFLFFFTFLCIAIAKKPNQRWASSSALSCKRYELRDQP